MSHAAESAPCCLQQMLAMGPASCLKGCYATLLCQSEFDRIVEPSAIPRGLSQAPSFHSMVSCMLDTTHPMHNPLFAPCQDDCERFAPDTSRYGARASCMASSLCAP